MSQPAPRLAFAFDDYLEWEKRQPIRHEFFRGEVFAMAGMTDKFAAYRPLDSLREYVRVNPERVRVQVYRRSDRQWLVDSVGPGERLRLESIDWESPVEKVYEDLSEPPIGGSAEPERRP